MENEKMLEIAIQTLSAFDPKAIETVQLERTKYDDGSVGYSVNVTFPAEEKEL
ncbi:hypothetical protein [Bacillus sp. FSL K6-3431]|uniref:hypothetical protein n=1 Tax=Bacillus sp. FSL K6-3431 TaxID=2921500 RepID=UPI0030FAD61E